MVVVHPSCVAPYISLYAAKENCSNLVCSYKSITKSQQVFSASRHTSLPSTMSRFEQCRAFYDLQSWDSTPISFKCTRHSSMKRGIDRAHDRAEHERTVKYISPKKKSPAAPCVYANVVLVRPFVTWFTPRVAINLQSLVFY